MAWTNEKVSLWLLRGETDCQNSMHVEKKKKVIPPLWGGRVAISFDCEPSQAVVLFFFFPHADQQKN